LITSVAFEKPPSDRGLFCFRPIDPWLVSLYDLGRACRSQQLEGGNCPYGESRYLSDRIHTKTDPQ